jgi:hypothetical protein
MPILCQCELKIATYSTSRVYPNIRYAYDTRVVRIRAYYRIRVSDRGGGTYFILGGLNLKKVYRSFCLSGNTNGIACSHCSDVSYL